MDLNELITQREELDKQIRERQAMERSAARENARRLIAEFSITPSELGLVKKQNAAPRVVAPKFRDPISGATWTGRGRAPAWIRDKDYREFAITD